MAPPLLLPLRTAWRQLSRHAPALVAAASPLPTATTATATTPAAAAATAAAAAATRGMASRRRTPPRRPSPRIRGAGAVPGPHPTGGVPSAEARSPSEAAIEAIRCPPRARGVGAARPRRWKVLRGDTVEVINGPWVGGRGRVLHVVRRAEGVVVSGVAVTAHKVRDANGAETELRTEGVIPVSNVAVVCPTTGRPTKVRYGWLEDGTKVRVAKVSGAVIPRPPGGRRVPLRATDGAMDTPPEVVVKRTYEDEEGLYGAYEEFLALCEAG
ncbi:hypothetical protein BU14_2714s0001, partial [Porphyra umbilicalis]